MIDSTVYHIDHEPQLFVDDVLIEASQAVTRVWHKPQRVGDGPIIRRDQPWEQSLYFTYSNYVVIRDPADGKIKCWYEDVGPIDGSLHPWKTKVLYAESTNGVNFTKPATGVRDAQGRETNICLGYQEGVATSDRNPWADSGVHSAGICIDPYPPTPDQRIRMIYSDSWQENGRLRHKTRIAHSADGWTWKKYPFDASIGSTGGNLNDVSCLHYDHDARMFVQNTRDHRMYAIAAPPRTPSVAGWFPPVHPGRPDLMGRRRVVQTRSADFIHWTEPVLVSSPMTPAARRCRSTTSTSPTTACSSSASAGCTSARWASCVSSTTKWTCACSTAATAERSPRPTEARPSSPRAVKASGTPRWSPSPASRWKSVTTCSSTTAAAKPTTTGGAARPKASTTPTPKTPAR